MGHSAFEQLQTHYKLVYSFEDGMKKYQELAKNIPWVSFGRETVASRLAKSIVPVGFLPYSPLPYAEDLAFTYIDDPQPEKYMMEIVGTAIQADQGKLITCAHVLDELKQQPNSYLLARTYRGNTVLCQPYRIPVSVPYYDPRTDRPNPSVDLAALIVPIIPTEAFPYDIPSVQWADSSEIGIGDPVIVGGYPLGRDLFLMTRSNRGLVQPTFYSGIVSAVIPAMELNETRLLQISIPVAGGMSGGAVFNPVNGEVIGMITSCMEQNGHSLPMSYAIPSEVIAPFVEVITYEAKWD
jgi:hypothetical protein